MTLREEIAEILQNGGFVPYGPDLVKANDQILSAFRKRLPEKTACAAHEDHTDPEDSRLCDQEVYAFNQAIEQIEGVLNG